ncbi:MAG: hypothetical protein JW871_06315 [Endomicrobiales bacterium]|nr:hypothetical protein [Endomicrobiales bacterium]
MKKILIFLSICLLAYFFINPYYLFPDGQGYFSYLPSMFFDGDMDFYNDFKHMGIPIPLAITANGYISNNWSFGTAFFWSPFYLAGKILSDKTNDPYGQWFWYWVNTGTIFYGILTFFLLGLIMNRIKYSPSWWVVSLLSFVGTPMFFYTFIISSTSHGITAFIVTLFIWYWLTSSSYFGFEEDDIYQEKSVKTDEDKNYSRYIILGILLGLAFMVRPQEALFGIVVLAELVFRMKNRVKTVLKQALVYGVSFFVAASPQLLIWKITYGSFLYAPSKFNVSLKYFSLFKILFSSYHGIFLWTPVFLLVLIGIIFGCIRMPRVYIGLLFAFLGQIFINSCCVAYWEGYSFGLRQMTSSLPIVALGIFEVRQIFKRYVETKILGWIIIALPCLWTLGLLMNYYLGLDLLGYLSVKQIFNMQLSLPGNILKFTKQFLSKTRPLFSTYFILIVVSSVLYLIFNKIRQFLEKNKTKIFIISMIFVLAVFDIFIIKAHFNKPERNIDYSEFITPEQLDEFFIGQVRDIKNRYNLK